MDHLESKEARVFQGVCAQLSRLVEFDRFYAALYDRRTAELDFRLVAVRDSDRIETLAYGIEPWQARPFRPGANLPDYLFSHRQAILVTSGFQTWLDTHDPPLTYAFTPPCSWLGVPLLARDTVMGMLVLEDAHREGAFGQQTQALLEAMARQAAGTLANLRLVESLRTVNRVGQRLTAEARQSVKDILELVHVEAGQLMDTRDMYVALYDAGRQELRFPLAYYNGKPEMWPSRSVVIGDSPGGGLTEEVIRTKVTLYPQNVRGWYEENDIKPKVLPVPKSWLGVPLLSGERVLGVIALQNDEVANLYSPDDREILEAMASQVAAALANAQLVERLRAVNEVGQRLTSGVQLSEGEILDLIHRQAGLLMDTRDMYVALYDAEQQELSFPLAYYDGERETWPSRKLLDQGVTEEVIRTRQPLNLADYRQWYAERGLEPPVKPEDSPKSWLGVPLMIEDRVLGVIALQNDEIWDLYGPDDVEVLQTMAGQAAFAVLTFENARLLEREKRRSNQLKALQDIGVKLASQIELSELLRSIADYTDDIMKADFSALFPYDAESGQFNGAIRASDIAVEQSVPDEVGFTANVAREQQPVFEENARALTIDKPRLPDGKLVESFACVPLVAKGTTVGVLYVNYLSPHRFTSEEKEIVQLLANQAAVAIENAELYAHMEDLVRQRTDKLQETQKRISAAEKLAVINSVSGEFVHRLNNLLGTVPVRVKLASELLDPEDERDHALRRYLDGISLDVRRLMDVVDVLQKGSPPILDLELVNLNDLVKDVIRASLIPPSINVISELDPNLPPIRANVDQVRATLNNLVTNAVDAMHFNGILKILTRSARVGDGFCVYLSVSDTGDGISEEDREKIFKIFYTTKDQGLGYGLWRDRNLAHRLGGDLFVTSEKGVGSTFTLQLPIEDWG
ncbi:MAG: GAF domain-containing protein [Sedimentisphaerales bacterium]|nr:GAF domain-containing protein [Sedimentisphaerales bacterium]